MLLLQVVINKNNCKKAFKINKPIKGSAINPTAELNPSQNDLYVAALACCLSGLYPGYLCLFLH